MRLKNQPAISGGSKTPAVVAGLVMVAYLALSGAPFDSSPAAAAGQPQNYYVSPAGSDSNDGSRTAPLLTVREATRRVRPGGTVYVEDGVYHESVWLDHSGTAGGWITFQAVHPHGAKIAPTGLGRGRDAFNLNHQSYIEIRGFELTAGAQSSGVAAGWGGHGAHIRVVNNIVHDCGASGIQLNHDDYVAVVGNRVFRCALFAKWSGSGISIYEPVASDSEPGFHNVVRDNICYLNDNPPGGTDGNGIIIDDTHHSQDRKGIPYAQSTLVENNLSFANDGAGVQVFESDYVVVRNNTCAFNHRRVGPITNRGELSNVRGSHNVWVNNIAWANPNYDDNNRAILVTGLRSSDLVWDNNLTFDGVGDSPTVRIVRALTKISTSANILGRDPMLVDPKPDADGNFHLRPGSPAIGAGTARFGVPPYDLSGHARSSRRVDIGAYAYDGTP